MASSTLERLFDEYAAYHRHPMNELTHYVGVPLIIFTLVGLLSQVSLGPVSLAVPVAAAAVLYTATLSAKLTLPFALFIALSFVAARPPPAPLLSAGFIGGWALQLVGHLVYEKQSPAFLKNLQQLLVGPLWLIHRATSRRERPWSASDRTSS